MPAEPLCIRTFGEAVRNHMNKNSTIKVLNGRKKFEETGQETKDASGVFVFYSLLLNSLTHAFIIGGRSDFPDISKQLTTYLKTGQSDVSDKFIEAAQAKDAVSDVSTCFSINLIPNIPKASLPIVMDAVLALIQSDSGLGRATQTSFQKWRKDKTEADFLAEAFVLSVRSGKNRIDNSMEAAEEFATVLDAIKDIEAKLEKLPKPQTLTPPDKPEEDERVYISALLDAYDDASDADNPPSEDLSQHPKFEKDLKQRRIEYFAAEAVRRGTRENFRNNDPDNMFTALLDETYNGVVDIHALDYKHGFERLLNVLAHATTLQLDSCLLGRIPNWVGTSQKKGVCHMLINKEKIKGWVDEDD